MNKKKENKKDNFEYDLKCNNLVSVIVPIYNSEKHLHRCIKSLINQKYKNIEILLINDGSSDNSLQICNDFSKIDNRIKVYNQTNHGVSYTRNYGIEHSSGKFIMFVDSDDYISEDMIYDMLKNYDYKIDLVISGIVMKNKNNKIISNHSLPDSNYNFTTLISHLENDIPLICICGPCCKLYKSDIIKNNSIKFNLDLTMGEDTDFNIQYYNYVKNVKLMSKIYYSYMRENEQSLFTKYYPDFVYINDRIFSKFLELVKKRKCSSEVILHFKRVYFHILFSSNNTNFKYRAINTKSKRINDLKFLISHNITQTIINTEPINIKEKIIFNLIKNNRINCLYWLFYLKNI